MSIANELARFAAPLSEAFASPDGAETLLRDVALLPDGPSSVVELPSALTDLAATADDALTTLMEMAAEEEFDAADVIEAVVTIASVLDAVQELIETASGPVDDFAMPFDVGDTWTTLATALPGYLLARWLREHHPVADGTLRLLGAVTDNGPGRARVDFDAIGALLTDPPAHMRTVVGDDPAVLLPPLQTIAAALGKTRPTRPITFDEQRAYVDDGVEAPQPPGLDLTIASPELGENWSIDVRFEPVTVNGSTHGLQVLATGNGELEATTVLSPEWSLTAALAVEGAAGFVIVPDGVRAAETNAAADASLTLAGLPETPWVLFGNPGATRLELAGLSFIVAGEQLESNPEVSTTIRSDGLRLVVAPGDGDSFISGVLGSLELTADASLALTWSSVDGFSLTASEGGIELTIPIERALGPIIFKAIHIGVGADPAGVTTDLGASLGFVLGPISASVENIGISLLVEPAAEPGRGAFGDVDFAVAFKPPTGLGIAVDATVATGGGYLEHDADIGRYAGAAELSFVNTGLTAVGIVTTQMPDGSEGWSMFLSLGIRLVGIQLGFGFTLNGVGGLVGINRGLDDDALGDAVRTGSLDPIIFPDDPMADAPKILADIDLVFPAASGQYVFGPVVKIGWGTPTLVELDVGVVLQLPDPLSLSLLGALSAVLPTEEVAVLELHVNFAGTVNITEGTLKIDASLSGSHVAGLEITGDMAVRADFFGDPTFLVAFGGFHPEFDPPDDFPALERVGVSLDTGDALRITLGGYFALTSNTVQFGSAAEIYAEAVGFTAEGGTTFDALIIFRPFGFDIALKAWVSISAGNNELLGVLLEGTLSGPNPWHAAALAEFRLLGLKAKLEIEATFGERSGEAAPTTVDVGALLRAELALDDAWSVLPPAGATPVIVSDPDSETLAVDPSGRVQVLQRIVPLEREIEVYGNATPSPDTYLTVEAVGFTAEDVESIFDYFAGSQYFRLDEDEKLSSPSFTLMKAGLALGGSGVEAPEARALTYDYEIEYRDPNGFAEETARLYKGTADTLGRALAASYGATTTSTTESFAIAEVIYVVANGDTGVASGAAGDYFSARSSLNGGGDMVIPEYEQELVA